MNGQAMAISVQFNFEFTECRWRVEARERMR